MQTFADFLCFSSIIGCGNYVDHDENTYIVATDATLAPMSFMSVGNKIIGFEPDLIGRFDFGDQEWRCFEQAPRRQRQFWVEEGGHFAPLRPKVLFAYSLSGTFFFTYEKTLFFIPAH